MASKSKLTPPPEWSKHLRKFGKKEFWSKERGNAKRDIEKQKREMEKQI